MYKDLLPIGSVVRLDAGERNVMICGRIVVPEGTDKIYDYAGCVYPEGISSNEDLVFFQDTDELTYRAEVLDELGELAVVDGEVVPVANDTEVEV